MLLVLRNNAAAGYQGPVKRELMKGAHPVLYNFTCLMVAQGLQRPFSACTRYLSYRKFNVFSCNFALYDKKSGRHVRVIQPQTHLSNKSDVACNSCYFTNPIGIPLSAHTGKENTALMTEAWWGIAVVYSSMHAGPR